MKSKKIKETDLEAALESLDSGWCLSEESKSVFADGQKRVCFTDATLKKRNNVTE